MSAMKVAVLGGGNGAHTVAADLTLKGLTVNMFEMEEFASSMQTVFDTGEIEMTGVAGQGTAKLNLVTTDLAAAIRDVEIIFIVLRVKHVGVLAHCLICQLLKLLLTGFRISPSPSIEHFPTDQVQRDCFEGKLVLFGEPFSVSPDNFEHLPFEFKRRVALKDRIQFANPGILVAESKIGVIPITSDLLRDG